MSSCLGNSWTALVTLVSAALVAGGLGTWYHFTIGACEYSRDTLEALGVDRSKVPVDEIRAAALVTLIVYVVLAFIFGCLALCRMLLATRPKSGKQASSCSTGFYLSLAIPGAIITWCAEVWLVLLHMVYILWLAAALAADKGGRKVNTSEVEERWSLVREVYQDAVDLIRSYNGFVRILPDSARRELTPKIDSIDSRLRPDGRCPQYCLNLSSWSFMDSNNSCVCDTDRFYSASWQAEKVWKQNLVWAMLGLGLALIGMSWITITLSAHIARTCCERGHGKSRQLAGAAPQNAGLESVPVSTAVGVPAAHPATAGRSVDHQSWSVPIVTDSAPSAPMLPDGSRNPSHTNDHDQTDQYHYYASAAKQLYSKS